MSDAIPNPTDWFPPANNAADPTGPVTLDEHLAFYRERGLYPMPTSLPNPAPWVTATTRVLTGKMPVTLWSYFYVPHRGFSAKDFRHRNLAIRTGQRFKLLAIDIDSIENGINFIRTYALPPTLLASSGQRGYHLYYRIPDEIQHIPSSHDVEARGIDIRSEFSYVTAPPSLHGHGTRYRFINPTHPIAVLPLPAARHLRDCGLSKYWHLRKFLRNYRIIKGREIQDFFHYGLLRRPKPDA